MFLNYSGVGGGRQSFIRWRALSLQIDSTYLL
jgi:hypothetical protein